MKNSILRIVTFVLVCAVSFTQVFAASPTLRKEALATTQNIEKYVTFMIEGSAYCFPVGTDADVVVSELNKLFGYEVMTDTRSMSLYEADIYKVVDGVVQEYDQTRAPIIIEISAATLTLKNLATAALVIAEAWALVEYYCPEVKVWRENAWHQFWNGRCFNTSGYPAVDFTSGVPSWH